MHSPSDRAGARTTSCDRGRRRSCCVALGDRLAESENLRWLSHVLVADGPHLRSPRRRAGLATAGRGSPGRARSWPGRKSIWPSLAPSVSTPAADDYAARAIEMSIKLGEKAIAIRARSYAALARVLSSDTGWDELEAAWRDAMATEERGEHAGFMGSIICWIAALHHDLDRAGRYIAETTALCRDHDLGLFEPFVTASDALVALHRGEWSHARVRRGRAHPARAAGAVPDHAADDPCVAAGPPRRAACRRAPRYASVGAGNRSPSPGAGVGGAGRGGLVGRRRRDRARRSADRTGRGTARRRSVAGRAPTTLGISTW